MLKKRDSVIYEMDLIPNFISTIDNVDYNSSIVLRALYETIFTIKSDGTLQFNGEYYCWDDTKTILTIALDRRKKWSDGIEVTSSHFLNQFYRIMKREEKHPIYKFLSYIKNWDSVMVGDLELQELGVYSCGDYKLVIELETVVPFFLEVLSSVFLSPYKDSFSFNGPYVLEYIENMEIVLKKNRFYMNESQRNVEWLIFRKEEYTKTICNYLNKKIHITGNTQFPHHKLSELRNNELREELNSNLYFILHYHVSEDIAKNITTVLSEKLSDIGKKTNDLLRNIGDFNNDLSFDLIKKEIDIISKNINRKKIKLLYSKYYPNEIIIKIIYSILKSYFDIELVQIEYDDIRLNRIHDCDNYILLDIVYFEFISILPKLITFMPYVKDIYLDEYIQNMEEFSKTYNNQNLNNCINILKSSGNMFILFELISYQFVSSEIEGFFIKKGHAVFSELSWKKKKD